MALLDLFLRKPRPTLHGLLEAARKLGATELRIEPGQVPEAWEGGAAQAAAEAPLSPAEATELCRSALTDAQAAELERRGEVELALGIRALGRFRARISRGARGLSGRFELFEATPGHGGPPGRSR